MNVINNRFRRQQKISFISKKQQNDPVEKRELDQTHDFLQKNSKKYHSSNLENKQSQYKVLEKLLKQRWLQNPLINQKQPDHGCDPLSSLRNDYQFHEQTFKLQKSEEYDSKCKSLVNHLRNERSKSNIQLFQNLAKEGEKREKYTSLKKEQPVRVTILKRMSNFYRKNILQNVNNRGCKTSSILQKGISQNQMNLKNNHKVSRKGSFQKQNSSFSTLQNKQAFDLILKKEESIKCKGDILIKDPFHIRRKLYLHKKDKYQTQEAIFSYILKS